MKFLSSEKFWLYSSFVEHDSVKVNVVINIHLPNGNNERSIGPSALFSDSILDENLPEQAISNKNSIPSTTKDLL